jgi:hemerythrin-like domain-containing protein
MLMSLDRKKHMDHLATRIILREHASISATLHSMLLMLSRHSQNETMPNFPALRAMLFYVDEFPKRQHHRKESEFLFPKLRTRTPISRDLLYRLEEEHRAGEQRIRLVEHALLAFEIMGEPRRQAFEEAAKEYVDFYVGHMALEEKHILPLAEKMLTEEDWNELNRVFGSNIQPLPGHGDTDYIALFHSLFPPIAESVRSQVPSGSSGNRVLSEARGALGEA